MAVTFDWTGRTVVLTGAASGIGAATLDLAVSSGADVHAVDIADLADLGGPATAHRCDLGDEAAVGRLVAALPDRIDVLLNVAGLPNGGRFTAEQVMAVNWLGLRQLTEAVLPRMSAGGAVVHVASTAGRRWPDRRPELDELLAADAFATGLAWVRDHPDVVGDGYALSKEAVQYYTLHRSLDLVSAGVRMNSVCPGVTDTPIADDFRRGVGEAVLDRAVEVAGRMARPADMAPAIAFLADDAAGYVTGVNLNVDHGTGAAHLTNRY